MIKIQMKSLKIQKRRWRWWTISRFFIFNRKFT